MVEVTQADRELLIELISFDSETIDAILAGNAFTWEVEQIARHRIAALEEARGDQVARVVEWLRKENGLCDCHARCETECGCGAWDDWKTKPLLEIADAIEQSFANKT